MIRSGYKVGDVFNVYGMKCRVGEDGHLVFPNELTFTEYKIDEYKKLPETDQKSDAVAGAGSATDTDSKPKS